MLILIMVFVFSGVTLAVGSSEMVLVEAGTTSEDNGLITVENDFYIGKYHVTQSEFEEVMGFNPSGFNDEDHPNLKGNSENRPVEFMTWYDTIMYANKLSIAEGFNEYYNISDIKYDGYRIIDATVTENEGTNGYRLPTKYEHEYSMRGGKDGNITTYSGSNDLNEVGWYWDNSYAADSSFQGTKRGTMPVGMKKANELGLYDMSGNVWDWTNTSSGNDRIRRGGCWIYNAKDSVVDNYNTDAPSFSSGNIGFRLARSP